MRLLLDTVAFIWAIESPERISKKAMVALQHDRAMWEMSSISISEIAVKQGKGKLNLHKEDVVTGIADLKIRVLPYTASHAYRLFDLPLHHADPFDRQIIAQALAEGIPIVTSDEKFGLYGEIEVIW
ncbi:MAG: type II toxin-antitoxin system VapC family toxin [Acidobacteriota bacterium]|nr:type II toxin-antitoxin system VapC family toxin [Acidobacteriota bacterium]